MKDAFRKHGKWLFIPAPILIFTGSAIPIPYIAWIGIALLCMLVTILVIQPKLKRTIIE